MIRIAYISEVSEKFGETDLQDVMRTSQRRNALDEITGMMMYEGNAVLQILEGPEENLRRCYNRIRVDPRHFNIHPIDKRAVENRAFSDWSMGLVEPETFQSLPTVNIHTFQKISERLLETKEIEGLSENTNHVISTMKNFMSRLKFQTPQSS